MSRLDDMMMSRILDLMVSGVKPTDSDCEYVWSLLAEIALIDPKQYSNKKDLISSIAGKCYLYCLFYENLFKE